MTQQMEKVMKDIEAFINFDRFNKVVNLATSLPSSTGDLTLRYENDELIASINSNKGVSDFTFKLEKVSEDKLSVNTIYLKAGTLKRLLNSFSSADKIGIAISDTGVTLEYKNIKAIIMHNI